MYCKKCGQELVKNTKFCPKCGTNIINNQEEATVHLEKDKKEEKNVIEGDLVGGWELLKDSFRLLKHRPLFLIPIFFAWIIYASGVLFFYFFYFPNTFRELLWSIFIFLSLVCFVISMANIVMLTLMQQIEYGRKISFKEALKESFIKDSLKVLPISMLWALIWLIILILEAITSRFRGSEKTPSLKNAAIVLSGTDTPFSWSGLGLRMLEKLIRMVIFLSLPAIAWENKGPVSSLKKSFEIIRKHPIQFLSAYGLTLGAFIALSIPLIPIGIALRLEIELPSIVWLGVIIYSGVIFILNIYLEQMVTGLLYLWHLKWQKAGEKGPLYRIEKPELSRLFHEFNQMDEIEKSEEL